MCQYGVEGLFTSLFRAEAKAAGRAATIRRLLQENEDLRERLRPPDYQDESEWEIHCQPPCTVCCGCGVCASWCSAGTYRPQSQGDGE